jgi:hypothetical protein
VVSVDGDRQTGIRKLLKSARITKVADGIWAYTDTITAEACWTSIANVSRYRDTPITSRSEHFIRLSRSYIDGRIISKDEDNFREDGRVDVKIYGFSKRVTLSLRNDREGTLLLIVEEPVIDAIWKKVEV